MKRNDLIYRLRTRASIRRQILTRKSVQEGKPDRIADLFDEAAAEIERLELKCKQNFKFWALIALLLTNSFIYFYVT